MSVNKNDREHGELKQFLTFLLDTESYGVDILHIREIIEYSNVTTVPLMPDFISGVINLRGSVVPVISLALRFERTQKKINKKTSIIIIAIKTEDGESAEIGIIVDSVNEVIELAKTDIAAAPIFGTKIRADFIQGMAKIKDDLMVLLDVSQVLSIDELSMVETINSQ